MYCLVSEIVAVEDSPFEYRSPRPTALLQVRISWMYDLSDRPDKSDQFPCYSHGSHLRSFPAARHSKELSIQPRVAPMGDLEQFSRLILAPLLNRRPVGDPSLVVPRCLYGAMPHMSVPGLLDRY